MIILSLRAAFGCDNVSASFCPLWGVSSGVVRLVVGEQFAKIAIIRLVSVRSFHPSSDFQDFKTSKVDGEMGSTLWGGFGLFSF